LTNQVNYEQLKTGTTNSIEFLLKIIRNLKGFLIALTFSAAIGGMMTLVGTGPTIFVKRFADQ
jgi:Na+/H+ antiporter NhaD/arsenite permease-like protein